MASNTKYGVKEVLDCTLYDMATNKPVIYFDTLKTSGLEFSNDKVYARGGKGNSKQITWEVNKEGTMTIEDALLSPKSLELITGIATKTGVATIYARQSTEFDSEGNDKGALYPLKADASGVIALGHTPKEAASNILVYLADDDCGEALSMDGATLSEKNLTVAGAANKEVVVYYTYDSDSSAQTWVVDASHFSGTYKLVGDTVIRNRDTGKDEAFQVSVPNLKWSSNLKLDFAAEGDPTPTSFECEVMKASNGQMAQLVKY